jgi:hypothetical protein
MTPKEKAKELVYKFYPNVQWKLGQEDCLDRAKRCALIAVDEVIKSIPCIPSPIPCEDIDACITQARDYWQQVKQKIENL